LWTIIVGGKIGTECGTISSGLSLVMNGPGPRYATTSYLNLTDTNSVQFTLQMGSPTNLVNCERDSNMSRIDFGYSLNGGLSWTILKSFQ